MAITHGDPVYNVQGFKLAVTGGASDANVFEGIANPFGVAVVITKAVLRITTASTGASTLDIGIGASITTADDTLMDGLSGATAGLFDNVTNKGTNGLPQQLWAADTFLTVKEASGDVAGLVGTLFVNVIPAA